MTATVTIAPVRKTLHVAAAPALAFEVFARRIGEWWPRTHHIGASPMRDGVIEPQEGGRWYEIGEDGSECDWGRVLVWDPPGRLVLSWELNARFQRDAATASEVEIRFVADGAGTRVELEHRGFDRLAPADAETLRGQVDAPNGWTAVLGHYAARTAG